MKQKINELLDRPWTTRGYLKLTGIVCVLYTILVGLWYLKFTGMKLRVGLIRSLVRKILKKKINTTTN